MIPAGKARNAMEWPVPASLGVAGKVRLVMSRKGMAWRCLAGMAWLVQERHGTARFVKVWQARFGPARKG